MEQQTGYGTYSLMIGTPKAALPDTGVEATTAWSMGALATAALVVGGAILFVRRRANVS
jgi:LPXTG-motif cell wall-anchored protein